MPEPISTFIVTNWLLIALGISAGALLIAFWQNIMEAVRKFVLPFLTNIDPGLSDIVADAFLWVDRNVAVPIRAKVLRAWRRVRRALMNIAVRYKYRGNNEWVRKFIAYLKQADEQVVVITTSEQRIDYEDVPPHIREKHMKSSAAGWSDDIDVTEIRDKEMQELASSLEQT